MARPEPPSSLAVGGSPSSSSSTPKQVPVTAAYNVADPRKASRPTVDADLNALARRPPENDHATAHRPPPAWLLAAVSHLAAPPPPPPPPTADLEVEQLPPLAPNAAAAVLASLPTSQHEEVRASVSWYTTTGPSTLGAYLDGKVGGGNRTDRYAVVRVMPDVAGRDKKVQASTPCEIGAFIANGARLEHDDLPGLATALGRPIVVVQRYVRGALKYLYVQSRLSLLDACDIAAARCAGVLPSALDGRPVDPLFVYNEGRSTAPGAYTLDESDPRVSDWARAARASFPANPKDVYPTYAPFEPSLAPPPPPTEQAPRSQVARTVSVGVGSTRPLTASSSAASLPSSSRPPLSAATSSSAAPRRPAAGTAGSANGSQRRAGATQPRTGPGELGAAADAQELRASSLGSLGAGSGEGVPTRRTNKVDRARAAGRRAREQQGAASPLGVGDGDGDSVNGGGEPSAPVGASSLRTTTSSSSQNEPPPASAPDEPGKGPARRLADLRLLPGGPAHGSAAPKSPRAPLPPSPARARTMTAPAGRSPARSKRERSVPPCPAFPPASQSPSSASPLVPPPSTSPSSDFWLGATSTAMLRGAERPRADEASSTDARTDLEWSRAVSAQALERAQAAHLSRSPKSTRAAVEPGEAGGESLEEQARTSETAEGAASRGSRDAADGGRPTKRRKASEEEAGSAAEAVEEGGASEDGGELERVQAEGARILAAYFERQNGQEAKSRRTWDGQRRPEVRLEDVDQVVNAYRTDLLLGFDNRDDPPALDQYARACDPDRSRRPRRGYKRRVDDELVSCRVAENEMASLVGFGAQAPSGSTRSYGEVLLPLFGFVASFTVDVYVATPRTRDLFTTEAGREWAAQEGVQGVIFYQTRHSAHFEQVIADVNAYYSRCNAGRVADVDSPRLLGAPVEMGGGVTSMHSKLFLGALRDGTGVVELTGSANLSASALSEHEPRTDRLRRDTNVETWRLTVLPKGCDELSQCLRARDGVMRALAEQGRLGAAPRAPTVPAGEWLAQIPVPTSRPQPAPPIQSVPIRPLPGAPRLFRGFAAIWAGNPELARAIHAKGASTNTWLSQDKIYGAMLSSSGWEAKLRTSKDGIGISMPDSRSSPLRESTDTAVPDGGVLAFTLEGLKSTWLAEHKGKNISGIAKDLLGEASKDSPSTLSESGALWHVMFDETDCFIVQISVPARGFSYVVGEGTSSAGSPFDGRTYSRAKMVGEFARRYRDVLEVAGALESVQETELGGSEV